MIRSTISLLLLALSMPFLGCAGNGAAADRQTGSPREETTAPAPAEAEEIIGVVDVTAPAVGSPDDSLLPTDPRSLERRARDLVERGDCEAAMDIFDVLLVLAAAAAEILELRAGCLAGRPMPEDAAADLRKCCALGRQSCCDALEE
jgi:hypothetical protein